LFAFPIGPPYILDCGGFIVFPPQSFQGTDKAAYFHDFINSMQNVLGCQSGRSFF